MNPAIESVVILLLTLGLFVWGRLRHDVVALCALFACMAFGLVSPKDAFDGLADPAVITVAAVLVVGRAIELTGVASALTHRLMPAGAPFGLRLAALMALAAFLSAFMNNIAALAVTMPSAIEMCRRAGLSTGAALMPLAFATILGGMTTLIGTPANLILSSFRAESLGAGFGFFDMTPVGLAVAVGGVFYLGVIGWRLTPQRTPAGESAQPSFRVFELLVPPAVGGAATPTLKTVRDELRKLKGAILGVFSDPLQASPWSGAQLSPGDRLLVSSHEDPWVTAKATGLQASLQPSRRADAVTARVVVARGSPLIGEPHDVVAAKTDGHLRVVAAGPRAAEERRPLGALAIETGDQLYLNGAAVVLANFNRYARLLEVDRADAAPIGRWRALFAVAIYVAAVAASVGLGLSPAVTFLGAAVLLAVLRFLPAGEIYSSIDWSTIILLAAMIPVGRSFEHSGAAQAVAGVLGDSLVHLPLFGALAVMATTTMVLSIFLNNVATAVIMGPIALSVAQITHTPADPYLLAVLIGASSDFLTPIGHQNNLLVMAPGGYRFSDYARVGAPISVLVITVSALVLSWMYS